jgi:uncharacterized protein YdhG (YjbR/CyaY superfamily)
VTGYSKRNVAFASTMGVTMDEAVQDYIDRIAPAHRPLFDRLNRIILAVHPDATVVISYRIPTYKVGNRRLHVGAWKHGLSIYGWQPGRDEAFAARHPGLKTGAGTLRLRPEDAASITDDELRDLVRAALDA